MRLLKAATTELVQFLANEIPPYAILSHTWSSDPDEEVLFSDIGRAEARQKPAYEQKLVPACKEALKRGFDYIWIDTCCIDKTSSAELQEAVNSMFKWYLNSSICFAYLEDVPSRVDKSTDAGVGDDWISKSRWFTRGWTLQELVAPRSLVFYTESWESLGTRTSHASLISTRTGIDEGILIETTYGSLQHDLSGRSVASRMSWAAFRETTRPEDIAYCLLGIFDVNMPLLYGEGEKKAFHRLQEEILKNSDDQSLLAWTPRWFEKGHTKNLCGPLAEHPFEFRNASNIVPLPGVPDTYSLTSSGLRIELLLVPSGCLPFHRGIWGVLRCHYNNNFTGPLAIPLEPQPWQGNWVYARRRAGLIIIDRSKLISHDIFQNGPFGAENQANPQNQTIVIHRKPQSWNIDCENLHLESWPTGCILLKATPEERWDAESRIMVSNSYSVTRVFKFEHVISKTRFAIVFQYSFRFPEPTLGMVRIFELDQDGELDPSIDMERPAVDCQIDPEFQFRSAGLLQCVRAALRKGHIMGVPFFVLNIQVVGDSTGMD